MNAISHTSHLAVQGDCILRATTGCYLEAIVDFFQAISARQSVRTYQATAVNDARLEKVLTAANTAPSAGNLQAYEIVVVRHAATRSALATAAHGQAFLAQAPIVLVFFADPARSAARYAGRGERLFCIQDATIAACYAQLAATDLGFGTCWVGAFDDKRVAQAVAAPPHLRPVCLLAIGSTAERPSYTSRRQLSDLVHEETFKAV
jgi:nitroreductase